jgi:hypothetical protein
MKTKSQPPASHSFIGYVVLFLSSLIITFGCMVLPLSIPKLSMFFPSIIGGVGLYLLLTRFMKSYQPLPLIVTLSPLITFTGLIWSQQNKEGMPMSDILEIWAGAMAGTLTFLIVSNWRNKSLKHCTSIF